MHLLRGRAAYKAQVSVIVGRGKCIITHIPAIYSISTHRDSCIQYHNKKEESCKLNLQKLTFFSLSSYVHTGHSRKIRLFSGKNICPWWDLNLGPADYYIRQVCDSKRVVGSNPSKGRLFFSYPLITRLTSPMYYQVKTIDRNWGSVFC